MLGGGLGVNKARNIGVSTTTPATMFANDDFFWINTARSPVTLDGSGNIELIENLGTFGGDMQQGTASNRPGYGITQLNGKDVIDLDGVSEYLESTLPAGDWAFLHDGTLYSVLTVFKAGNVADPDAAMVILATSGPSNSVRGQLFSYDDRSSQNLDDTLTHVVTRQSSGYPVVNVTDDGYAAANTWHHAELLADPSNSTAADRSIITADDQSEQKNNSNTNSVETGDPVHTLRLGQGEGARYFTGQFAETVIVKGRIITANELSKWNTYVQNEWGI